LSKTPSKPRSLGNNRPPIIPLTRWPIHDCTKIRLGVGSRNRTVPSPNHPLDIAAARRTGCLTNRFPCALVPPAAVVWQSLACQLRPVGLLRVAASTRLPDPVPMARNPGCAVYIGEIPARSPPVRGQNRAVQFHADFPHFLGGLPVVRLGIERKSVVIFSVRFPCSLPCVLPFDWWPVLLHRPRNLGLFRACCSAFVVALQAGST
jgi:hypothetical protein